MFQFHVVFFTHELFTINLPALNRLRRSFSIFSDGRALHVIDSLQLWK